MSKKIPSAYVVLCCYLFPLIAEAIEIRRGDYVLDMQNPAYIFVMLASDKDIGFGGRPIRNKEIRNKYSESGLYSTTEQPNLIWSVDWYSLPGWLHFDQNGEYLVRFAFFTQNTEEVEVEFFRQGVLTKSYAINDLVSSPGELEKSRITPKINWVSFIEFNSEKQYLYLATVTGETYLFNVKAGEVFHNRKLELKYAVLRKYLNIKSYLRRRPFINKSFYLSNGEMIVRSSLIFLAFISLVYWWRRQ